jgi:hypothetical protein
MAIVKDPLLLRCVRGSLGDEITIYERNGQIIMAKKRGPSKNKPTPKQLEARYKLKIAAAYAREILLDPAVKAFYKSKAGPGQNAYNMAVKDAYHSPEIQNITLEDMTVTVRATDAFRVEHVEVDVKDAAGKRVGSGRAQLQWNGVDWKYTVATLPVNGKIVVRAVNMPGNETVRELPLPG